MKLKCDVLRSTSAYKFNLRRYTKEALAALDKVGWCKMQHVFNAPGFSSKLKYDEVLSKNPFPFKIVSVQQGDDAGAAGAGPDHAEGGAVQVDPMKSELKAPEICLFHNEI